MTNEAKELLKSKPELCKEIAINYCETWWSSNDANLVIWESFLKEHTKKDWEILSFKSNITDDIYKLQDNGEYKDFSSFTLDSFLNGEDSVEDGSFTIHSVRRLSDNEVFTDSEETMQGKINRFGIVDGTMMVECESKFAECDLNINDLIKRTHIFTTEDGKPHFEGDEVTPVQIRDLQIFVTSNNWQGGGHGIKYFSTREAAEKWVEDNKPKKPSQVSVMDELKNYFRQQHGK